MRVVLASKSPRRKELLKELFKEFDIISADCDESLPEDMHPQMGVAILAACKGEAVLGMTSSDDLIISSDTLVELDGVALGKPTDAADAKRMLLSLSGRTHNVHTGVAVHYKGRVASGTDTSSVTFRALSDEEIDAYIATGEPMDKAGAYGIQGKGGALVSSFDGRFDTVVGLSVSLTKRLIEEVTK